MADVFVACADDVLFAAGRLAEVPDVDDLAEVALEP